MKQVEYGYLIVQSGSGYLDFCEKFPKYSPTMRLTDAFDELGRLGWIMCAAEAYDKSAFTIFRFYRKIKSIKRVKNV